jgi:hypothetical protein
VRHLGRAPPRAGFPAAHGWVRNWFPAPCTCPGAVGPRGEYLPRPAARSTAAGSRGQSFVACSLLDVALERCR